MLTQECIDHGIVFVMALRSLVAGTAFVYNTSVNKQQKYVERARALSLPPQLGDGSLPTKDCRWRCPYLLLHTCLWCSSDHAEEVAELAPPLAQAFARPAQEAEQQQQADRARRDKGKCVAGEEVVSRLDDSAAGVGQDQFTVQLSALRVLQLLLVDMVSVRCLRLLRLRQGRGVIGVCLWPGPGESCRRTIVLTHATMPPHPHTPLRAAPGVPAGSAGVAAGSGWRQQQLGAAPT